MPGQPGHNIRQQTQLPPSSLGMDVTSVPDLTTGRSFDAGALRYRGGPHPRYVFRRRRGPFLRPPHVRDFVKEGYFFVSRYEVWGSYIKTLTLDEREHAF